MPLSTRTLDRLAPRVPLALFLFVLLLAFALPAQSQIGGTPEAGDEYGRALASGDFNGDGHDDLAVGIPGENSDRGFVNVIYGAADGLTANDNQLWNLGVGASGDEYGFSLATGDFNGDGFDDLAIGAPFADLDGATDGGIVGIIYGTQQGLVNAGSQAWNQSQLGATPEFNDQFGFSLATGDFNGDGQDDLAIGTPREDIGTVTAGAVSVLYGTTSGLTAAGVQNWDQGQVGGTTEVGDNFGRALAAGDFDGDGRDDLAIGAPGETVSNQSAAGEVSIVYGTPAGLQATGFQNWGQYNLLPGNPEAADQFGSSLTSGDFNADGRDDLIVGAPGEDDSAGILHVIYGASSGLTASGNNWWWQGDIDGTGPDDGDRFGSSLAAGDFDGDGRDDLAVGVPGEDRSFFDIGEVDVFYGSSGGIQAARSEWYIQDDFQQGGKLADFLGWSLASGDFNGDGTGDLAIGLPFEDVFSAEDGGAVHAVFGLAGSGVNAGFNQHFFQGADIIVVSDEADAVRTTLDLGAPTPNPVRGAATLRFDLATAAEARLTVYNLLGHRIAVLADGAHAAGPHEVTFDASGLAAGVYVARLESGGDVRTTRLTVVR